MATERTRNFSTRRRSHRSADSAPDARTLGESAATHTRADSLEQQAFLALVQTQSHLGSEFERLFREHGLSAATYNTLGVLRDAGAVGRNCQDIGEHLVAVTPDVTRLIDRLQASGLCARVRSKTDRRVVIVRITQAGLDLLSRLDGPVRELHARQLGHLSREQMRTLIDLLAACRAGATDEPDGRSSP